MKRLIAACLAALSGAPLAASAGDVFVTVDRPGRYALPEGVAQVFVANPQVADVEIVSATQMLVLGRMPGQAQVVLYGPDGTRLDTVQVQVANERRGVVTLYNGAERYSFHCTERCEPSPMLGDGPLSDMATYLASVQQRAQMGEGMGGVNTTVVEVPAPQPAPTAAQPSAAAEPAS